MRPTALTIEGLTCFRDLQSIDFTELDLFVITGPTGAGKTSILDAITFALYGDVCRVKSGQLRDLISHGSTHLKVSLEFRVNGAQYRIARRLKKSGGGHEAQLVRVEADAEVPEVDGSGIKLVNERIEEVLGLDFAAFTKAVLLPQGAFHEFLKGDASARRRILISLLDLHRYERAGARARERARLLAARLDERRKLIESEYAEATAERLKEAKAREKEAKDTYKQEQEIESRAKEKVAAIEAGQATAAAVTEVEQTLRTLESEVADLAGELLPLLQEDESCDKDVAEAEAAVKATDKERQRAGQVVSKTIDSVGDETLIARLESAARSRKDEHLSLASLDAELKTAQQELARTTEQHTKAREAENKAKAQLSKAEKTSAAARAAFELAARVLECSRATADEQRAGKRVEATTSASDEAHEAAQTAAQHVRHLERTDLAAALRAGLKPGDSCPVCEAAITKLPKTARDTASLLQRAKVGAAEAEDKRLKYQQAYMAAKASHDQESVRLTKAKAALPAGAKVPPVEKAEAEFTEADNTLTEAQQELEAAAAASAKAEKTAAEADGSKREAVTKTQGCERELKAAKQRLEKAEKELRGGGFPQKLPPNIEEILDQRRTRLKEARDRVSTADEALQAAQKAQASAFGRKRDNDVLLIEFDKRLAETRTTAETAVQALERFTTASVPALPGSREERSSQLQAVKTCCGLYIKAAAEVGRAAATKRERALRELATTIAPLEIKLPGEPSQLLKMIANSREDAHRASVEAGAAVSLVKEKISKRGELERAAKEDTVLCARYRTLGQELQQDHFIAFVLAESMERLAALATVELLRVSGGRYSLVVGDDGYDVVDHHNANERRSVATLSGGETFLASLALALALAGSVRDLAGTAAAARLDAIFIDEGFGALDPETLEVVIDALERLREGERMVGVISHVDELADRIPDGLTVSKSGNSSRILVRGQS